MSDDDFLKKLAPGGYYLALRVGFAFPMVEVNELPEPWVDHYTRSRFMLNDPVIRWVYGNSGAIRWSAITLDDPMRILACAKTFGLRYGAAVSHFDGTEASLRSFGSFVRGDREFTDTELTALTDLVRRRHSASRPPDTLTGAELEALDMVRRGLRLKQIAHELGVTEGAIKQRLKNAKGKLNAKTSAQAAAQASKFGLI